MLSQVLDIASENIVYVHHLREYYKKFNGLYEPPLVTCERELKHGMDTDFCVYWKGDEKAKYCRYCAVEGTPCFDLWKIVRNLASQCLVFVNNRPGKAFGNRYRIESPKDKICYLQMLQDRRSRFGLTIEDFLYVTRTGKGGMNETPSGTRQNPFVNLLLEVISKDHSIPNGSELIEEVKNQIPRKDEIDIEPTFDEAALLGPAEGHYPWETPLRKKEEKLTSEHETGRQPGHLVYTKSHMHHLDGDLIDSLLLAYPEMWRDRVPQLDKIGRAVRSRVPIRLTRDGLIAISDWKAGERNRKRLPTSNNSVLLKTQIAFEKKSDREKMSHLISSWSKGCGMKGVGVPLASAILRFVYPDRYCCVDWRNWYVLSRTENKLGDKNRLFNKALLPSLDNPFSSNEITVSMYIEYMRIVRWLAQEHSDRSEQGGNLFFLKELVEDYCCRTPAEIDMALFSYSWMFIKK